MLYCSSLTYPACIVHKKDKIPWLWIHKFWKKTLFVDFNLCVHTIRLQGCCAEIIIERVHTIRKRLRLRFRNNPSFGQNSYFLIHPLSTIQRLKIFYSIVQGKKRVLLCWFQSEPKVPMPSRKKKKEKKKVGNLYPAFHKLVPIYWLKYNWSLCPTAVFVKLLKVQIYFIFFKKENAYIINIWAKTPWVQDCFQVQFCFSLFIKTVLASINQVRYELLFWNMLVLSNIWALQINIHAFYLHSSFVFK